MDKPHFLPVTLAAMAAIGLYAGPLDQAKVAGDAKWVVHVDFEAFHGSKLGRHITETMIRPKVEGIEALKKLNLSVNLTNISGLTAYGSSFDKNGDGVLMLSTTAEVKKDLDTLVGMAALSESETKDITMVQQTPYPLYSLKDGIFVAPGDGLVVLAKSRDQIGQAREVITGKTANLAKSTSFNDYPKTANTFFFLGLAEGFNENANIPPQAQVLREAKGGRLVVGEKDQNVFVNLIFKGKDEESSTKIQQVLQGIVALVSLSQQDKEITELAAGTKIASEGKNVSVNLQFPVAKALAKIEEKHQPKEKDDDDDETEEVRDEEGQKKVKAQK